MAKDRLRTNADFRIVEIPSTSECAMPLLKDLPNFKLSEFRHPEIIEAEAADFLQAVRTLYGQPMTVTSDGRTPEENAAAGGSPTSWHLRGRAFDVRAPGSSAGWWNLVDAIITTYAVWNKQRTCLAIELELCPATSGEPHLHFALKNDNTPCVLLFG